jgi:hypothetical protein
MFVPWNQFVYVRYRIYYKCVHLRIMTLKRKNLTLQEKLNLINNSLASEFGIYVSAVNSILK